jgi:hypothetical protein
VYWTDEAVIARQAKPKLLVVDQRNESGGNALLLPLLQPSHRRSNRKIIKDEGSPLVEVWPPFKFVAVAGCGDDDGACAACDEGFRLGSTGDCSTHLQYMPKIPRFASSIIHLNDSAIQSLTFYIGK